MKRNLRAFFLLIASLLSTLAASASETYMMRTEYETYHSAKYRIDEDYYTVKAMMRHHNGEIDITFYNFPIKVYLDGKVEKITFKQFTITNFSLHGSSTGSPIIYTVLGDNMEATDMSGKKYAFCLNESDNFTVTLWYNQSGTAFHDYEMLLTLGGSCADFDIVFDKDSAAKSASASVETPAISASPANILIGDKVIKLQMVDGKLVKSLR